MTSRIRGFSLVEVMIALTLFALLAIGMASLVIGARKASETIIYEDQINRTLSNFLEEIRGTGYARVKAVHLNPSVGFDLTLPKIGEEGAIQIIRTPVAIVDENSRNDQWTSMQVETATKDGDVTTSTLEIRLELNDHDNFVSESTNGMEIIINYRWKLPWKNETKDYRTGEMMTYVANQAP